MQIKVINNKEDLNNMEGTKDTIIYILFRPSDKDIFESMKKFKKLKAIVLSKTYTRSLSASAEKILKFKKIKLINATLRNSHDVVKYYETKQ